MIYYRFLIFYISWMRPCAALAQYRKSPPQRGKITPRGWFVQTVITAKDTKILIVGYSPSPSIFSNIVAGVTESVLIWPVTPSQPRTGTVGLWHPLDEILGVLQTFGTLPWRLGVSKAPCYTKKWTGMFFDMRHKILNSQWPQEQRTELVPMNRLSLPKSDCRLKETLRMTF